MKKLKFILRLLITMLKIGLFTFGGGYAMIALLENEFIEKKKWIEKDEFLNMVAIAESTPSDSHQRSNIYRISDCRTLGCACSDSCRLHTLFHYYFSDFIVF